MKIMKKNLLKAALIIIGVLVIGEIIYTSKINLNGSNLPGGRTFIPEQKITPSQAPAINLQKISVKFKNGKSVSGSVYAQTAYDALSKLAKDNSFQIEVKQYKFGIMVTKIGGDISSSQYYWSYKVNGRMGTVAADRYILKPGDLVEWEYVKISQ